MNALSDFKFPRPSKTEVLATYCKDARSRRTVLVPMAPRGISYFVTVRRKGDTFHAKFKGKLASSTASGAAAAVRVAAKVFGCHESDLHATTIREGVRYRIDRKPPLKIVETLIWNYVEDSLPSVDTTCLIATDFDGSDEIEIAYYAGGGWFFPNGEAVTIPVFAWANAPAKPAKKGAL